MITNKPTIVDLVKQLRDESTLLIREEVALAKKEMSEKVSRALRNSIYLVAGALIVHAAVLIALYAISSIVSHGLITGGLREWLAVACGFLIIAVVTAVVGGGLISKARDTLREESLIPKKTIQTLKDDKNWAKQKITQS